MGIKVAGCLLALLTQMGLSGGQGLQKEALGRVVLRNRCLEPDPSERPDCRAGSRVQPQEPQTGVHRAQCRARPGGLGLGAGSQAKPKGRDH